MLKCICMAEVCAVQELGDRLTVCPYNASCSVGLDLAIVPSQTSSTTALAAAAYRSLQTSSLQVGLPQHCWPAGRWIHGGGNPSSCAAAGQHQGHQQAGLASGCAVHCSRARASCGPGCAHTPTCSKPCAGARPAVACATYLWQCLCQSPAASTSSPGSHCGRAVPRGPVRCQGCVLHAMAPGQQHRADRRPTEHASQGASCPAGCGARQP